MSPAARTLRWEGDSLDLSFRLRHLADRFADRMPKASMRTPRLRPTKEVSVMAWIEDSDQNILLVGQSTGLQLWTLPGGKVKRGEITRESAETRSL
jgi:hypothetical protein